MSCYKIVTGELVTLHFAVVFHAVRCNITGRECLYTDGGILDQYPIHCFDGTYI